MYGEDTLLPAPRDRGGNNIPILHPSRRRNPFVLQNLAFSLSLHSSSYPLATFFLRASTACYNFASYHPSQQWSRNPRSAEPCSSILFRRSIANTDAQPNRTVNQSTRPCGVFPITGKEPSTVRQPSTPRRMRRKLFTAMK